MYLEGRLMVPLSDDWVSSPELRSYQRQIRKQIEALNAIVADPALLTMLRDIHAAPEHERRAVATKLANLQSLRDRGLNAPEGMRVTTRYFEATRSTVRGDAPISTTESTAADRKSTRLNSSH